MHSLASSAVDAASAASSPSSHASRPNRDGTASPARGTGAQARRRSTLHRKTADAEQPPAVVALIDEHEFTRDCISTCLDAIGGNIIVRPFSTVEECAAAEPNTFDLVMYHLRTAPAGGMGGVLARLRQAQDPTPVLVVSDIDSHDAMVEAFAAGARGYLTTASTSLQVAVEVMRLVRVGGIFAPVTDALMERTRSRAEAQPSYPIDQFTSRQLAVLEYLLRGDANKVIAHKLSMSESTVKVHVRNIMKKMQATNRVQAVFRAFDLETVTTARKAMDAA